MNILIQSVAMHLWSAYAKSFNVPYDADGRIRKAFWIIYEYLVFEFVVRNWIQRYIYGYHYIITWYN